MAVVLKSSLFTACLLVVQTQGDILRFGTNAPPFDIVGFELEDFPNDTRATYYDYTNVRSGFGSDITFSRALEHRRTPDGGFNTWSHGYHGDVYYDTDMIELTIGLPPMCAFVFYLMQHDWGTCSFRLQLDNGEFVEESITSAYHTHSAEGFGIYDSGEGMPVSLTITDLSGGDANGFAVGEFYGALGNCSEAPIVSTEPPPFAWKMCKDVNEAIYDHSSVTVPFVVSKVPYDATGIYVYVDLVHSYLGDLNIFLTRFALSKQLFDGGNCGGNDDMRALFSDNGTEDVCSGTHSYDRVYDAVSYESLTAFNSMTKTGLWEVTVEDNGNDDSGTLKQVCLGWGNPSAIATTTVAPQSISEMCEEVYSYIGDFSAVSVALDASQFPADASGLYVYVDLQHSYLGHLSIRVQHADTGKTVFYGGDCGSKEDLRAYFSDFATDYDVCPESHTYDKVYDLESFESLTDFKWLPKNGIWNVTVEDHGGGDEGTLKKVCVGWGQQRPEHDGDGDDDSGNNSSGLSGLAIGGIVAAVLFCTYFIFCDLMILQYCPCRETFNSPAAVAPRANVPAVASGAVQIPAAAISVAPRAAAPMECIGGFPSVPSEGMADTRGAAPVAAIGPQPIAEAISAPPVITKVKEWALPSVDPSTFGGFPQQLSESLSAYAYVTPSNDPILQATAMAAERDVEIEMVPPTHAQVGDGEDIYFY